MRIIKAANDADKMIMDKLIKAYRDEIETAMNYLAVSTNMRGIMAQHVVKELAEDVDGEMEHAKTLADRIHVLGGTVPTSVSFSPSQKFMEASIAGDLKTVIRSVIKAEKEAISTYRSIFELCNKNGDWATQDLVVGILADEEDHLRDFLDFARD